MKNRKILVSGAGIAGPALAFWLNKYGFEVTVVERAESLRLGGQNIDVKGAGQEVIRRMGIEDRIRAANTTEIGSQFVDENSAVIAQFPKKEAASLTSELEILRGDLAQILYDLTKDDVRYVFGDYINSFEQDETSVAVTFASGRTEIFDLLIAADGIGSNTRKLIFGDEPKIKYLGILTAYLTLPKKETDTKWARWYIATGARNILLRPDNHGTTRAAFNFRSPDKNVRDLPLDERKALLNEKLTNAGWEAARIVEEIDRNDELYFDAVSQVKAPRWSNGKAAMIGDAAYCPSPFTGMGTTLALVGAYVLAGELARHDDHREAFAAYERRLRAFVESKQRLLARRHPHFLSENSARGENTELFPAAAGEPDGQPDRRNIQFERKVGRRTGNRSARLRKSLIFEAAFTTDAIAAAFSLSEIDRYFISGDNLM